MKDTYYRNCNIPFRIISSGQNRVFRKVGTWGGGVPMVQKKVEIQIQFLLILTIIIIVVEWFCNFFFFFNVKLPFHNNLSAAVLIF